jgi:hypothetical protein
MDEISNKTLAILLIGAIVISLGGTLISLNRLAGIRAPITGFATTDTASVDLEISSLAEVNFTTDSISWGTGTVVSGKSTCTLDSYSAAIDEVNCSDFTPQSNGLVLENIGNKNLTLALHTGKTAMQFLGGTNPMKNCIAVMQFLGGTNPMYQFNVSNKEENSCDVSAWQITQGEWQDAQTTNLSICDATAGGFRAESGNDELNIDVRVAVPSDAVGAKSDIITAEIAQI